MIPKERIFLKGDVMNALNIQKKINTPKLGSPVMLQIAINKLNYNLRTQNKTEHKSQAKKEVFFPYLDENGITTVFDLGDTFDRRKYINYVSLQRGKEFLFDELAKRKIDFHALIGNHDTYYSNVIDVNSMNLLLQEYPTFKLYQDLGEHLTLGSTKFLMLPWISKENAEKNLQIVAESDANILMGHLEVKGFEMMKGAPAVSHGMSSDLFSRYEMVLSGHYHTKSSRDHIHYRGVPYEITWADYADQKYFHVLDTATRELSAIKNPLTLFNRIVYDDIAQDYSNPNVGHLRNTYVRIVVANKKDPYVFDKYIDAINSIEPFDLKIVESFTEYAADAIDDSAIEVSDTPSLLNTYVDAIETDLDKNRIKSKLHELYTEAQLLDGI